MEEYNNNDLAVPFYTEEEVLRGRDKQGNELKHPFSCDFMTYDKRKHWYVLTEKALIENGIDYGSMQSDELKRFLEQISRAVYSFIKNKAGVSNYAMMMYRIAKGMGAPNLSHLDFRTIFLEEVLLIQAAEIAEGGYAKDMPKTIMNENGRVKANDLSEKDGYWLHDDVITTLSSLNLTNSQRIRNTFDIKWNEY